MLTSNPTTKEQLIYYMITHISLGTYDKKFLDNIVNLNVTAGKPVTSNQANLLNKIIARYHRQLAKTKLDSQLLIKLPWTIEPIESIKQFTEVHITFNDDKILLSSPYKKELVKKLRQLDYGQWDSDNRFWIYPFSEYTLKNLIKCISEYFTKLNYCETINELLSQVRTYDHISCYWNPTLVSKNDNLYIAASNPHLENALKTTTLTTELSVLAKLVSLGVTIDKDILTNLYDTLGADNEAINIISFAVNRDTSFEISETVKLVEYLNMVKCDFVLVTPTYGLLRDYTDKICTELKNKNIPHKIAKAANQMFNFDTEVFRKYNFPVVINAGFLSERDISNKASKIINIVNSQPVELYK